jgi:very-short-patch-repair endonuclease
MAKRQHGVVSIRQLLGPLGYSRSSVKRKVEAGYLHPLYRGVYAVGHTDISLHGRCLAAVLAAGPGALASHYSAAWVWGLSSSPPSPFHVTVATGRGPRSPVHLHRARNLAAADRRLREGIPVTSVARTLLDQAAVVRQRDLRRLLKRAEERRFFNLVAIHAVMERNRGHRGTKPLRTAIRDYEPPPFTRSEFEAAFFDAVLAARLPRPCVNFNVAGMELDLYWPQHRFAVELDLYETHGTRDSFESDRLRQEDLLLEGIAMTRVTGPRFAREPGTVLVRINRLLAERQR